MNDLVFVKGKGLITKSIQDFVVGAWFECSTEMYYKLCNSINKVLTLQIEVDSNKIELNCNICTDNKTYLQYIEDHGLVKLDIQLPDILLSGYILKGEIKLFINE